MIERAHFLKPSDILVMKLLAIKTMKTKELLDKYNKLSGLNMKEDQLRRKMQKLIDAGYVDSTNEYPTQYILKNRAKEELIQLLEVMRN